MGRRIARARLGSGQVGFGLVSEDASGAAHFVPIVGSLLDGRWDPAGPPVPLTEVELLCPVTPTKVVGIGPNYRAHAVEMGRPIPPVPKMFLMPATAVVGPGDAIAIPPGASRVDHEAELAVVIGRRASRVAVSEALDHVVGFTVANDVTARDFQKADKVFARAKGFDTFCPLGPWVAVDLDPSDLGVRALVDGKLRQEGRTSDLIFDLPTLVSFVSHVMTLLPGDVIATGTPSGVGPLRAGQVVRVEVEGIGAMENPVVDREDRLEALP
ncbi:MAG: 2-hydroxyhepta-2,4-diene-1,7-dioate isomerase [Deltaproteobacteria bacterium]|nr:2-hydroxyhepta-2,4-diene-1,7-dioate isomerase [Deltaproteobacteria bacterium]